tara:strand:- start:34 stop:168 length:135 start_codon:yes stop_codon:yes gene_type:complete
MSENEEAVRDFREWLKKCPTDWWTMQQMDGVRIIAFHIEEDYDA